MALKDNRAFHLPARDEIGNRPFDVRGDDLPDNTGFQMADKRFMHEKDRTGGQCQIAQTTVCHDIQRGIQKMIPIAIVVMKGNNTPAPQSTCRYRRVKVGPALRPSFSNRACRLPSEPDRPKNFNQLVGVCVGHVRPVLN